MGEEVEEKRMKDGMSRDDALRQTKWTVDANQIATMLR